MHKCWDNTLLVWNSGTHHVAPRLGWLANKPKGPACLPISSTEITAHTPTSTILYMSWGWSETLYLQGYHICKVNYLLRPFIEYFEQISDIICFIILYIIYFDSYILLRDTILNTMTKYFIIKDPLYFKMISVVKIFELLDYLY